MGAGGAAPGTEAGLGGATGLPGLTTPHAAARLSVMAAGGISVEETAAGLGLSPAAVEAGLRRLGLAAGKAPGWDAAPPGEVVREADGASPASAYPPRSVNRPSTTFRASVADTPLNWKVNRLPSEEKEFGRKAA